MTYILSYTWLYSLTLLINGAFEKHLNLYNCILTVEGYHLGCNDFRTCRISFLLQNTLWGLEYSGSAGILISWMVKSLKYAWCSCVSFSLVGN